MNEIAPFLVDSHRHLGEIDTTFEFPYMRQAIEMARLGRDIFTPSQRSSADGMGDDCPVYQCSVLSRVLVDASRFLFSSLKSSHRHEGVDHRPTRGPGIERFPSPMREEEACKGGWGRSKKKKSEVK
ncbi:hypothetical protein CDD83_6227 [Cordyceps sp. RAO-2017]|nr:hypothetical protein CDD83_6227 [Cordyceps sp. RAO-2017]